ncbi:MAG: hypothetical protein GY918_12430 [Gammaproteobacteria bacterium]|nr:hypothetical protein [Gammaproteobacteria bacterium]
MPNPTARFQQGDPLETDQLQAVIFYLMTQFSFSHCPIVAGEIVGHIKAILEHPNIELLPKQRAVLSSLLNQWRVHRCTQDNLTTLSGTA